MRLSPDESSGSSTDCLGTAFRHPAFGPKIPSRPARGFSSRPSASPAMSDSQPTATPSEPSAPPTIPAASPAQPTPAPPALRHLETIPGAGWRDGAWMSSSHFAVAGDAGVWPYAATAPEPRRAPVGTSGDGTALAFVAARRTLVIGDRDGQVHSVGMGS